MLSDVALKSAAIITKWIKEKDQLQNKIIQQIKEKTSDENL